MIVLDQDIKDVQALPAKRIFPDGFYTGQIVGWKARTDKYANYYALFKWQLEGQADPLFVKYYLKSPNYPEQAQKGLGKLKTLCDLLGASCANQNGRFVIDPAAFMNKPCQLFLKTWEFNGRQGNYIESIAPLVMAIPQTSVPETLLAPPLPQKGPLQNPPADLNDDIPW